MFSGAIRTQETDRHAQKPPPSPRNLQKNKQRSIDQPANLFTVAYLGNKTSAPAVLFSQKTGERSEARRP